MGLLSVVDTKFIYFATFALPTYLSNLFLPSTVTIRHADSSHTEETTNARDGGQKHRRGVDHILVYPSVRSVSFVNTVNVVDEVLESPAPWPAS